jgi:uncharacterized iron-regulated membrane protein
LKKHFLKKVIGKIHLWLGLASGLVVFIMATTACFWVFQQEIRDMTETYRQVEARNLPMIPPSQVYGIAAAEIPGRHIHSVNYGSGSEALEVLFYEPDPEFYQALFLDPYSGEVLHHKDFEADFFHFMLDGHMYLWLPHEIGKQVTGYATLIFVVMLISGIILWWPKNKKALPQRLKMQWKPTTRWKRKNYDLHNILGFYASAIALVIAITGLVWSFTWVESGLHTMLGGEKSTTFTWPENTVAQAANVSSENPPIDRLWQQMEAEYPEVSAIEMHYPPAENYSIYVYVRYSKDTYWDSEYLYFDNQSLQEIKPEHMYGRLAEASVADKFRLMNYDIHVGAIGGLAGKILAFFTSLIVASLPVTGCMIWWGRHKKDKQKKEKKAKAKQLQRI